MGVFVNEYVGFWNMTDWFSIIYAYVILGLWIGQVVFTRALADEYGDVQAKQDACGKSASDIERCNDELRHFFDNVVPLGAFIKRCRMVQAFYPLIIVLRLFKAFSAQPRLAVVTDTLVMASSDLLHFGIVFLAVFMSFVVMGTALFGRELAGFVTFTRTAFTLFRALMGDFDIDEMRIVGRELSMFYFAALMGLGMLILLNMLIAILMDVYGGVKANIDGTSTLARQAIDMVRRANENRQGRRIPLAKIEECILQRYGPGVFESEEILTIEDFRELVPGLGETQAGRTLERACDVYGRVTKEGPTLQNLIDMMSVLSQQVSQIQKELSVVSEQTKNRSLTPQADLKDSPRTAPSNGSQTILTNFLMNICGDADSLSGKSGKSDKSPYSDGDVLV